MSGTRRACVGGDREPPTGGTGLGAGPVGALVLAAGRATRMGRPKVVLPWRGQPILAHVLGTLAAAGVAPVVVVTGPDTPPLGPAFSEFSFLTVFNPEAASGMGSSLAAGARVLQGRVGAALVCLGDQPGIAVHVVAALVAAAGAGRPVVPVYRGHRGHPVLFPAGLLPDLGRLTGDRGARSVLERHPPLELALDWPLPLDVDTEEDYRRLLGDAPDSVARRADGERGDGEAVGR